MSKRDEEWFNAICESYAVGPTEYDGVTLPKFPADQIQINTTGQAGCATLREAFVFYQDCRDAFVRYGQPSHMATHRLLDFGVGWGRITRFFLREISLDRLYGVDVDAEFVEICRNNFQSENFRVCAPFPPTDFADGFFRYVIGYSVFSHLSEVACNAWMEEFARIVSTGGIVALTTRGRPFFDYCESLQEGGHTGYLGALSKLFPDFSDERRRYDRGEFVHSNKEGVTGGGPRTAEFYGETFIPREYAAHAFSAWFELVDFVFEPRRQTHPIMLFRRK